MVGITITVCSVVISRSRIYQKVLGIYVTDNVNSKLRFDQEYTQNLLDSLWYSYGTVAAGIRLHLDLQPVSLPVDIAVPCGLILNELAGNALKHAFPGQSKGELKVSLKNDAGRIRLSVADNGVGLPPGLDWQQGKSLGLRLVQMLARQVDAKVEANSENGTRVELIF